MVETREIDASTQTAESGNADEQLNATEQAQVIAAPDTAPAPISHTASQATATADTEDLLLVYNRWYAFICGVSDYMVDLPNQSGGELPENFEGANRLQHCLIESLGVQDIFRVDQGGEASASNAIGELVRLSRNSEQREDDLYIIFFSTKGAQTGGLQFTDRDQRTNGFSVISFDELADQLERFTGNLLLILECCYAGKVRESLRMQALVRDKNVAVLYSSAADQETEATGPGGQLFVDTLIKALKGDMDLASEEQKSTLAGRMRWVADSVDIRSQRLNRRQTPYFWCMSDQLSNFEVVNAQQNNINNRLDELLIDMHRKDLINDREKRVCKRAINPEARDSDQPQIVPFIDWLQTNVESPQEIEQHLASPPMAFRRYLYEAQLKRNNIIAIVIGVIILVLFTVVVYLMYCLQLRTITLDNENAQLRKLSIPVNQYFPEISRDNKYYDDIAYCGYNADIFKGIEIGQSPARSFPDLELPREQAFIMFANAYTHLDSIRINGVKIRALRPSITRDSLIPSYLRKATTKKDCQFISILNNASIITEDDMVINTEKGIIRNPSGKDVGHWLFSDQPTQEEIIRWLYCLINTSDENIDHQEIVKRLIALNIIAKDELTSKSITRGEICHWLHNALCYMKYETNDSPVKPVSGN